jgi:hypothetical protein
MRHGAAPIHGFMRLGRWALLDPIGMLTANPVARGRRTLADATTPPTTRPRRRWLLIGPPVVILLAKGANTLVQLALTDTPPDRVGLVIAFAALSIIAAFALLVGGRIGWLLAIGVLGWDLAASIFLWWIGTPQYVAMTLLAVCAFLLTTPEMRAAHTSRPER